MQCINLRVVDATTLGVSLDETCNADTVANLFDLFLGEEHGLDVAALDATDVASGIPAALVRTSAYLTHPVFNTHHSETEMLRYLKQLEIKDLALNQSMIPLGSCTMKLNATSEMIPITWPEFANLHPFVPAEQAEGYKLMIDELEAWLRAVTGFDAICMQPNSGAQGEYAGLLAIRKYHESRGDAHRNICLIPASAHGTNPASAQMASMRVQIVECDTQGNVDLDDLKKKASEAGDQLSCLMATYPSTHGVYEEGIRENLRSHPRPRRPGVHGWRQPQRPGGPDPSGRYRRRRVAHEPAQDLLHPSRRWRPRHGSDRRACASGAVRR